MNSIVLSKKQFAELRELIYDASGINIHEGKLELLKSKIAKRMRLTRTTFDQYLHHLKSSEREIVEFIDTVTTNHSFFFRENNSVEHVVNVFEKRAAGKKQSFKIWCAACSTGDEPYSIAVQLKERNLDFSILATDISHSVIETATRGVYRMDRLQHVPMALLHRYFQKGSGKYQGYVRVKKQIIDHVRFSLFNLIADTPSDHDFDAVFCRNVMIYFDLPTSEAVVNKLYKTCLPGGFFAIGNAESLMNLNHRFKAVPKIPSLYQK